MEAGRIEAVKNASGDMPATTGSRCFDCNICLDFAADPVVTLCGHLYCWPCIYAWMRPGVESTASDNSSSARRQCPVCKATLSMDALVLLLWPGRELKEIADCLVPLYGYPMSSHGARGDY